MASRRTEVVHVSNAVKLKPTIVTAEKAYKLLEEKFAARFKTVQRAFITMDQDNDGFINLREFRAVLENMGVYMSGAEFRKLWRQFDISGDGKINYTEFNNKVGYMILPYGAGLQMRRPETPKIKEWQQQAIAKAVQKKIKDIEVAFKEIDTDGSGRISHPEFIQALRKVGLAKIGDAESYQMMTKFRRPTNTTGEMTFDEFKDCMTSYMKVPTSLDSSRPAEKPSAALEIAEKAIRTLPKNVDKICSFFTPFDKNKSGELHYDDFKLGLEAAGLRLSNAQFLSLCYKLDAIDDGIIAYKDFARYVVGEENSGPKANAGASLDAFTHWVANGIRPAMDLVTGRPMDRETAVKRAAAKTGLSEGEIRVAHALLGRRQDLRGAFMRYDSSKRGEMSREDVMHMFEALDVPCNNNLTELLFQKYDLNRNGELDYPEFEKWMGPLMELNDGNLKRLQLERIPPEELKAMREANGESSGSSVGAGGGSGGSVRQSVGGAASAVKKGGSKNNNIDDNRSVATAAMDLDPIAARMRKLLGKSWKNVAADIHSQAAKEASRGGGDASAVSSAMVPASIVRDSLAAKGVPLTSKEVRALTLKYHGAGIPSTRTLDGSMDVDKVMADVFGNMTLQKAGPAGGANRPPAHRPQTASATMRSNK